MILTIIEYSKDVVNTIEKQIQVYIADFDTGIGAIPLNTISAKGGLVVGTAASQVQMLPVGTNGESLIADSAETGGMRWGSPSSSFAANQADTRTATGTVTLTDSDKDVQYIDPGGASRDVVLPAEGTGNHPFFIYNSADAAEALTIKNDASSIIGVLNRGDSGLFVSNATTWSQSKQIVTKILAGFVSNPQAVYAQRAQVVMFRAPAAITITRIHIHCSDLSPTAELAGDLKFADDVNVGGFANAVIIDVCDTTNGVKTITSSFDDATVPSGKYVYFSMDASPHADIKDFYIEVYYTVD